ncbi:MAG: hypothetical protein HFG82_10570 [Dorea sp.]|jgi:hypothetical protein|nr:hypothetical protein [Dorea sp.]
MYEKFGVRCLNAAKEEDRAELLDFLGGERFLTENMPYIRELLDTTGKRAMRRTGGGPAGGICLQAYYDEGRRRLCVESNVGLEGANQFTLSELKVLQKGKLPIRFRKVYMGENRFRNLQEVEIGPEGLKDLSIQASVMWKNGNEIFLRNQTCQCGADQIIRQGSGVRYMTCKAPVKKAETKSQEIVISYGRKDQYHMTCDYDLNVYTDGSTQMVQIPFDFEVGLETGEIKDINLAVSNMYLVGNKGTVLTNQRLRENLCVSGTNPFRIYLKEEVHWGCGLTRSGGLQNENFKLSAGIAYTQKDGSQGLVMVQSTDAPQPYAGGYRMDIPMLKLYWGCLGKDTLVETADGAQRRISEIRAGDRIKTGKTGALGVVRDIIKGTEEKLWRLETENGESLQMTKEHPLLCTSGWRSIWDLKDEDEVYSVKKEDFVKIRYVYPVEYHDEVYNLNIEYPSEEKGFWAQGFVSGDFEMQNTVMQEQRRLEQQMELPGEIQEQIQRFTEIG